MEIDVPVSEIDFSFASSTDSPWNSYGPEFLYDRQLAQFNTNFFSSESSGFFFDVMPSVALYLVNVWTITRLPLF